MIKTGFQEFIKWTQSGLSKKTLRSCLNVFLIIFNWFLNTDVIHIALMSIVLFVTNVIFTAHIMPCF